MYAAQRLVRSLVMLGALLGTPLPSTPAAVLDSSWLRWAVRLFGLAVFLYSGMALLFGGDRLTNPIFGVVYRVNSRC